jgi:prophage DNA circulation protein
VASVITDLKNPWRDGWQPASFRGAFFYVESNSKSSGRRIVLHEFPKRDFPYPEDMGRHAWQFTVRGYLIQYPFDNSAHDPRQTPDYRIPRDALIAALEAAGPGVLQLPTIRPVTVVCPEYRWTEETNKGGYVVFDMTFQEYGTVQNLTPNERNALIQASQQMAQQMLQAFETAQLQQRGIGGGAAAP